MFKLVATLLLSFACSQSLLVHAKSEQNAEISLSFTNPQLNSINNNVISSKLAANLKRPAIMQQVGVTRSSSPKAGSMGSLENLVQLSPRLNSLLSTLDLEALIRQIVDIIMRALKRIDRQNSVRATASLNQSNTVNSAVKSISNLVTPSSRTSDNESAQLASSSLSTGSRNTSELKATSKEAPELGTSASRSASSVKQSAVEERQSSPVLPLSGGVVSTSAPSRAKEDTNVAPSGGRGESSGPSSDALTRGAFSGDLATVAPVDELGSSVNLSEIDVNKLRLLLVRLLLRPADKGLRSTQAAGPPSVSVGGESKSSGKIEANGS